MTNYPYNTLTNKYNESINDSIVNESTMIDSIVNKPVCELTTNESAFNKSTNEHMIKSVINKPISELTTNDSTVDKPLIDSIVVETFIKLVINKPVIDKPITNIEFRTKHELYIHYGINVKIVPDRYEVKLRYIKNNGKTSRLHRLAKK